MTLHKVAGVAIVVALGYSLGSAQTSKEPLPQFEVASVRPSKAEVLTHSYQPGGRFTATAVPLALLVAIAYEQPSMQISGLQGWMTSDRFDIVAKAEHETASNNQMQLMLQALLAERFKLRVRFESKEMPVYRLMRKPNTGLGSQLVPVSVDCEADRAESQAAFEQWKSNKVTGPPPVAKCGFKPAPMVGNALNLSFGAMTFAEIAASLRQPMGRPVLDETGVTGQYNLSIAVARDSLPGLPFGNDASSDAPPIAHAFEQLGLKLESGRGAVQMLIVDHAEQPTPN